MDFLFLNHTLSQSTNTLFVPNRDFVGNIGIELTASVATFGNALSLQQICPEMTYSNLVRLRKSEL